ncbi:MAG: N5-carboxyaminoimidazole ribonucleotide synthase [Flavobacteriaceae bacterium]|nr:MAG: N5-carboxyaminoimidazole ribonucleotide synthase [Flavobacteriaceae bacterium]
MYLCIMANYFSSNFTLGILGGGQLGKMMLYQTRKFDITTHVLDPSFDAPCRISCDHFTQGDLMNYDAVFNFGKKVDILTLEIEGVNLEAIEALEKMGKIVYPSANTLRNIQNKGVQKKFYQTHHIPTAAFSVFDSISLVKKALANDELKLPFVWKSCTGGYDGKGVQVIKTSQTLEQLPDCPCVIEDLVNFKNELAVIVARNPSQQVKTYPVVEMEFHPQANQVEYVICPARIDKQVAEKARNIAIQVSKAFEHVGLLAVEMFQTIDDQIIVNEVAPRPHNSGHYSIEASYTNQFEQHIRAVLDLPLGNTASKVGGIMVNLVGEQNHTGDVAYQNIKEIMAMDGVTPHIYGKKQTRPFRKMGHVTIVNENIDTAREIAQQVKQRIKVISK